MERQPFRDTGNPDAMLDAAIVRAKEGDWNALDFIYIRFSDDVYGYVLSILRDRHEAEDVTQDVFTKVMTAIRNYEQRSVPFAAWITRVARNAAIDHMRRRRAIPFEEVGAVDQVHEHADSERLESLRIAIRSLPDEQREVMVLRHVAGLSPSEIAERLGKTEGAVHGLHHRGRGAVRTALEDLGAAPVTSGA
jgi:RNA polymerase sigma-70 factor (ECF subfamily)